MSKVEAKEDFNATKFMINCGEKFDHYMNVFPNTNENIRRILESFDIKGKRVLTVLSSGEQAFNFLNKDASSVETFDINKLTFYYYYLRVWSIKYFNEFNLKRSISKLLSVVKAQDKNEQQAFEFWSNYYLCFGNDIRFLHNNYAPFAGRIRDLSYLKKRLDEEKFVFYNIDIADKIHLNKKYDIIYASNIPRWILRNHNSYINFRNNLSKLIEDDGKVICANVTRFDDEDEINCMSSLFEYHPLEESSDIGFPRIPGYYYTKK